jgi:hypothetical protein
MAVQATFALFLSNHEVVCLVTARVLSAPAANKENAKGKLNYKM